MQGPWENNKIYTLRHSARSGDMLWNVIPHCHESRWDLQMREKKKRKVSSHKGEGACTKVQRPEIPWVYEKWAWSLGCKKEITEKEVGSVLWETWNPMVCCHPPVATQQEAWFSSLLLFTPQRSNKDKDIGWSDGNKSGHLREKEVKPVLTSKAEMR